MATQITKVVRVAINGQYFRCKHDSTFSPGGHEREPVPGDGKAYVGFTADPVTATFEFTLLHANDLDLIELKNLLDMAIDVYTDTGQIYRIGDAQWSTPPSMQSGEISTTGFGKEAKKIV